MKKEFLISVMTLAALSSCTSDEVLETGYPDTGEIRLNVVAGSNSRAANSYCNHNRPDGFNLWVYKADGTDYVKPMGSDENVEAVDRYNSAAYKFKGGPVYWPDESLNFIAWKNADAFNYSTENPQLSFTVEDAVENQKDLLYSLPVVDLEKGSEVNLTLKHALSQVVFKGKVTNSFKVTVKEVGLYNIYNKADFNLNTETWANFTGSHNDYSVALDNEIALENEAQTITSAPEWHNQVSEWSDVMQLIPQTKSTHIMVKCDIKANDTADDLLWGGITSDKWLYIPVSIDWKPGKRYVYTIVFGDGGGGLADPDDDTPVINEISLKADVLEYDEEEKNAQYGSLDPDIVGEWMAFGIQDDGSICDLQWHNIKDDGYWDITMRDLAWNYYEDSPYKWQISTGVSGDGTKFINIKNFDSDRDYVFNEDGSVTVEFDGDDWWAADTDVEQYNDNDPLLATCYGDFMIYYFNTCEVGDTFDAQVEGSWDSDAGKSTGRDDFESHYGEVYDDFEYKENPLFKIVGLVIDPRFDYNNYFLMYKKRNNDGDNHYICGYTGAEVMDQGVYCAPATVTYKWKFGDNLIGEFSYTVDGKDYHTFIAVSLSGIKKGYDKNHDFNTRDYQISLYESWGFTGDDGFENLNWSWSID